MKTKHYIAVLFVSIVFAAFEAYGKAPAPESDKLGQYWDNISFTGSAEAKDRDKLKEEFVGFIGLFPGSDAKEREAAVSKLMEKASSNPETYSLICEIADEVLFDTASPLRNDQYYIPFLSSIVSSGILSEAEREKAKFQLEMVSKNLPGTTATDFCFLDRNGSERTLHSINPEQKTILLFYNPDCDHCREAIEKLKESPLGDNVRVAAIDVEEDMEVWKASKHLLPSEWTVGFALDPIIETDIYVLMEMPTLYLLDIDKSIILKDASLQQILDLQK